MIDFQEIPLIFPALRRAERSTRQLSQPFEAFVLFLTAQNCDNFFNHLRQYFFILLKSTSSSVAGWSFSGNMGDYRKVGQNKRKRPLGLFLGTFP
uniref:Uncharacterized protein n=1 Tax=Romanomermis culicivorax TaxID=13658 RepID=A0A915KMJ0_ROMCU